MRFDTYDPGDFYDELFAGPGQARPGAGLLIQRLASLSEGELLRRQQAAERAFVNMGITFNVYGSDAGIEKVWPFDIIPRIVEAADWRLIEGGLEQRLRALNLFIDDIYHRQAIVRDGIIPGHVIHSAKGYLKACEGLAPPHGLWCHIAGIDLVRDGSGQFYVLEDNLRCPSGVSYVLENRRILKRMFPQVFEALKVRPVDDYPNRLLATLQSLAPEYVADPTVVLLTPGIYNSAYFEHSFLAQQMGIELVEGRDLVVLDGSVCMRTTQGFQRVDVIYRRIDDEFLDPLAFRPDSMLGVAGLMEVYKAGRVAIANAPGTGIADDKVVYAYVPKIIKYYLGEEALLPNVPTYGCWDDQERAYVLEHLDELVVKAANESGGYGMLIGPHATAEERREFAGRIQANPRNYIAQPTLDLSRVPVLVEDHFEGRHVDLRPFVLCGKESYIVPGGLTRVALKRGSLVVNSSQGGGSKDTWVLHDGPTPAPEG
ncbi:MAG: circularly permuted type 2 ATP-grasp protein [Candidatus Latescibacteria bacterium]|nr:circularly permuted type 2 ATP-grasp protein [Candidatus Latescibacterota bacterium]